MSTRFLLQSRAALAALFGASLMMASPAWAGKPDWAQGGHGDKAKAKSAQVQEQSVGVNIYFGGQQRQSVLDYYAPQIAAGKCPPGLAKKNNGCRPPGLAKQWGIGQPLPQGVVTYPLPADLQRRLGKPPAGHEFVRVAGDILLIAVGTSMVIDAIEDLAGK